MIVEGVAYGEDCGLIFCGEKPRLAVASNQTKLSVSAIVNVSMSVEKWLLTGYLLKVAILTVSFYEIKSCGVIP